MIASLSWPLQQRFGTCRQPNHQSFGQDKTIPSGSVRFDGSERLYRQGAL
jgi:hypothetical protein